MNPLDFIIMREHCKYCGCDVGQVHNVNGQACVSCDQCGRYAYNAPKWELAGEHRADPTTWFPSSLTFNDSYTYVYRVYGRAQSAALGRQKLLYIGATKHPLKRMRQHAGLEGQAPKPWAMDVGMVTFEPHLTRTAALHSEARAIQNEAPAHNFQYRTGLSWGCQSSHCQVIVLDPTGSVPRNTLTAIASLALDSAQEDGDPIVYNLGPFWWLACDLPKVVPGAMHQCIDLAGVIHVEGMKPAGFPVPEVIWKELRTSSPAHPFAPPFPERDAA